MRVRKSEPGTPALRAALRDLGYKSREERGVQLWIMLEHAYRVMREIALEIEANERAALDASERADGAA